MIKRCTGVLQAFCLGHTKYVSSVVEVDKWLASGGGDGTVKLWEPTTGHFLSEVVLAGTDTVVQQLLYLAGSKQLVCLLNGSTKLIYISVEIQESGAKLNQQTIEELSAPAIAMCKHSDRSVIVLVDDKDTPLQVVPDSDKDFNASISHINQDLNSRWHLLEGAVKCQTAHFADMPKKDLQAMEKSGKKRKHDSVCDNGGDGDGVRVTKPPVC